MPLTHVALAGLLTVVAGQYLPEVSQRAATTNYYISSTTGSDANSGTSPDAAWATLSRASTASMLSEGGGGHTIGVLLQCPCCDHCFSVPDRFGWVTFAVLA